jgi:hypothetical protein
MPEGCFLDLFEINDSFSIVISDFSDLVFPNPCFGLVMKKLGVFITSLNP